MLTGDESTYVSNEIECHSLPVDLLSMALVDVPVIISIDLKWNVKVG